MIRFRLGQAWKRERELSLQDSFGLDIDGVDLLAKATEESLATVVPDLVEAVSALYLGGESVAQLSLAEAHLEIAMHRRDNDVDIAVVDLGRPAHISRGPIKLELPELATATLQCARALVRDLAEWAPSLTDTASMRRMMRQLHAIEHHPIAASALVAALDGLDCHSGPVHPKSFGFELTDAGNLVLAFGSSGRGALTSLLFGGSVAFWMDSDVPVWQANGPPFLLALEISRQAGELSRAIELHERALTVQLGGVGAPFALNLASGRAAIGAREYELTGSELARSMFNLGLSIAYLVSGHNRNQRRNPYIAGLVERCREGLVQLRAPLEPSQDGAARARTERLSQQKALNRTGRLRRLRFTKLWEKHRLGGDQPGRILLGPRGPVFASAAMACGFSTRGELLFRRISAHGVAASRDHWVVRATPDRVEGFRGAEKGARWVRDRDGLSIGPELNRKSGLLFALAGSAAVVAFSELTGREVWRFAPGRARDVFLSIQGHRALIAADSGHLYGLDLHDGQVRYRLQTSLPLAAPPIAWGKKMLAMVGRRERFSVLAADAHRGTLHWKCEFDLNSMSAPVPQGSRVFVAGDRAGQGVLLCLGLKGQPIWERRLHLGSGPFALLAPGQRVIACSPRGAAVCISSDGQIEWRLGALPSELLWPCAPVVARGVAIIPGELVRAVDIQSGEALAEVRSGIGLCGLRADSKLNLYLLDEDGTLSAYRLASHFAIVSGKSGAR
jgi:outer membrane protein assembly factor BamB